MSQTDLMVFGDRQTGKTHLALLAAIYDAHQGKRVLWQACAGATHAQCRLDDAREMIERLGLPVVRYRAANGKWAVDFVSGGFIHFRSGMLNSVRPLYAPYDLHVADDDPVVMSTPLADRIIRTVCTEVAQENVG